jgi:hypothetical protein
MGWRWVQVRFKDGRGLYVDSGEAATRRTLPTFNYL